MLFQNWKHGFRGAGDLGKDEGRRRGKGEIAERGGHVYAVWAARMVEFNKDIRMLKQGVELSRGGYVDDGASDRAEQQQQREERNGDHGGGGGDDGGGGDMGVRVESAT